MESITVNVAVQWALAACAAILTISNTWKIIAAKLHPESDLRDHMKEVDEKLSNDHQRLSRLEHSYEQSHEFEGVISRVLIAQINHELSGNDVNNLRHARDELNDFLTRR